MTTEWAHKKLGEIGEIISGGTPSTGNDAFWNGDVLFVTPLDLGREKEIEKTLRTISEYGVINSSANKIKANSLTISTRAPIGLMSIVKKEFTTNQGCKSIQFFEDQDAQFHYYNLLYNVEYIKRFGQGTTFMEISKTDFSNLKFRVPKTLPAQRRIAAILSSADKVIASTQKLIAKYKQMKQGLMEDLLKPKEGWKMVRLGECLTIGNGQDYKHLQSGDIPVYGTGGVMTYVDDFLYDGETVCIGRKGTINKPIFHEGKIWTVDTLFYTHSFIDVSPLFIYYVFCNIDWNKYNEATGVPSLSKESIYKIEIPVPFKDNKPDLTEQQRIASILSGIDVKIEAEERVLEKYGKVKKGLMERLLNE